MHSNLNKLKMSLKDIRQVQVSETQKEIVMSSVMLDPFRSSSLRLSSLNEHSYTRRVSNIGSIRRKKSTLEVDVVVDKFIFILYANEDIEACKILHRNLKRAALTGSAMCSNADSDFMEELLEDEGGSRRGSLASILSRDAREMSRSKGEEEKRRKENKKVIKALWMLIQSPPPPPRSPPRPALPSLSLQL